MTPRVGDVVYPTWPKGQRFRVMKRVGNEVLLDSLTSEKSDNHIVRYTWLSLVAFKSGVWRVELGSALEDDDDRVAGG